LIPLVSFIEPEAIEEFGLKAIAGHFQGVRGVTGGEFSPGMWDSSNW